MSAAQSSPEVIRQACVVPYRHCGDEVEFCLITSLQKKRWIFPKGIIDPGETLQETALKESWEEAGVHGRILAEPLGTYEDEKWRTKLLVTVVLMEVIRCADQWPEADVRLRRWADATTAAKLLSKESLQRFAKAAVCRIVACAQRHV